MPLIYTFQERENSFNIRNTGSRREVAESFRRYVQDNFRSSLQQYRSEYSENDNSSSGSSTSSNSDESDTSPGSSLIEEEEEDDDVITSNSNIININITQSSDDEDEDAEEEEEEEEDDNTTVTESFTRSRVDVYRLAIRTNSEILEDLAAIIRILRQINAIYRVFNNSNTSNRYHTRRRSLRRRPRPILLHHRFNDDDTTSNSDEDYSLEDDDEDEEANKLLEAGLEDLQAVLTMENSGGIKRQSTLALLSLITYQRSHCSDNYLQHYLDPNGEYNPELSIFAAATYDEEEEFVANQRPRSCKHIMDAAEELYGPDWLNEFHAGKEGALRKMLEKLTFVAQIRLKIRDSENISSAIR